MTLLKVEKVEHLYHILIIYVLYILINYIKDIHIIIIHLGRLNLCYSITVFRGLPTYTFSRHRVTSPIFTVLLALV